MADHYEILGVNPTAGSAEIRQAYMRLARERHPDRYVDPTEKARAAEFFKSLSEAFNTLSNERARREYDALRERPAPRGGVELGREAWEHAQHALEARQFADAAELLRAAVAHDGSQPRYHVALGRVLARDPARVREAVEAYENAVRLDPRLADAYLEQARLLLERGMKVRAGRVVEAGLAAVPGHAGLTALARQEGFVPPAAPPGGGLLDRLRKKG